MDVVRAAEGEVAGFVAPAGSHIGSSDSRTMLGLRRDCTEDQLTMEASKGGGRRELAEKWVKYLLVFYVTYTSDCIYDVVCYFLVIFKTSDLTESRRKVKQGA